MSTSVSAVLHVMMSRRVRFIVGILFLTVLVLSVTVTPVGQMLPLQQSHPDSPVPSRVMLSDDSGMTQSPNRFIIVELVDGAIPTRGSAIQSGLVTRGVVSERVTPDQLLAQPSLMDGSILILDRSVGSESGTAVSDAFIHMLISHDRPLIALGRAAWTLHRLRETTTPNSTAPLETTLLPNSEYSGAVIFSYPYTLSFGTLLSDESCVLPVDPVYTETSRIVNLTSSTSASEIAPLRYDSWPLDTLLLGIEDPLQWTDTGWALFLNILAYAPAMGESLTSQVIGGQQADSTGLIRQGMFFSHEPTLEGTYLAVHTVKSLLSPSAWTAWRDSRVALVRSVLDPLYVDLGTEAGFKDHPADASVTLSTTAEGLWLVYTMALGAFYDMDRLTAYVSSRQSADGGFESDISVTSRVVEALYAAGRLNATNTVLLERWLRGCVIYSNETSDPDLWGAVAASPSSLTPKNIYASQYLCSLTLLGKTHDDPTTLTQWILTHTSLGDGSHKDSPYSSSELVSGTASALTAMAVMGTLSLQHRDTSLAWLAANQLSSGGFGTTRADSDIVGKMYTTSLVATALQRMGLSQHTVSEGILGFVGLCESPVGFELMAPLPTLMWSYWLGHAARASHASLYVDMDALIEYIRQFTGWAQYPPMSNLTVFTAPEYEMDQYRPQSVWTHLFGAGLSIMTAVSPTPLVSETVSFVRQCQTSGGHFRPTTFTGTPHMQYTVAAVEALYLLDSLGSIRYRSALDSAVLSLYQSGTWSASGWTLRPFCKEQSAIDFLSTRAAVRLGLVTPAMATEIAGVIGARIQYEDLWALSMDVASLSLLVSNGLLSPSSLEMVDSQQLLTALSSHFVNGWYNESVIWQPVFTADILRMMSMLGLRLTWLAIEGSRLDVVMPATVNIGESLEVNFTVTSAQSAHSIWVHAFGEWTRHDLSGDAGTLSVTVPLNVDLLGPQQVHIMLCDSGRSRAFAMGVVETRGVLAGAMNIQNPSLLIGDLLQLTLEWYVMPSMGAGQSLVEIQIGEPPVYRLWSYVAESPLSVALPTDDLSSGTYDLTVRVTRQYCDVLILHDTIRLDPAQLTTLSASSLIECMVGSPVHVPWSLTLSSTGAPLVGQVVLFNVTDVSGSLVYSSFYVSTGLNDEAVWTPQTRGTYTFTLRFLRNGTLEGCSTVGQINVWENTVIQWQSPTTVEQYSVTALTVQLRTSSGSSLAGQTLSVVVRSPSMQTVLNSILVTDSAGRITFQLTLSENGVYLIEIVFTGVEYLHPSDLTVQMVSWSSSVLTVESVSSDALLLDQLVFRARLVDALGTPVVGVPLRITIVFLPTVTVMDAHCITDENGTASWIWTAPAIGLYSVTITYSGSVSRGGASAGISVTVRMSINLTLESSADPVVGTPCTLVVRATGMTGDGVPGLTIYVIATIEDQTVLNTSVVTDTSGCAMLVWSPTRRGPVQFVLSSPRVELYEAADANIRVDVFEQAHLQVAWQDELLAVSNVTLRLVISDSGGHGVSDVHVTVCVRLENDILVNASLYSMYNGVILLSVSLTRPGVLQLYVDMADQSWLLGVALYQEWTVLGQTILRLNLAGVPIQQGTSLGIVATLLDCYGLPLTGQQVRFTVLRWDDSVSVTALRVTGVDGRCTLGHLFDEVGDYRVLVVFEGAGLNAMASVLVVQRVQCTPDIIVTHSSLVTLGDAVRISISVLDEYGQYVVGRPLTLNIWMAGQRVYAAGVESADRPVNVTWIPTTRGLAQIEVIHNGDYYYLFNSTYSSISVMEIADGVLTLGAQSIDLFDNVSMVYEIDFSGPPAGIVVLFQVFDIHLLLVWSATSVTDASGMASVTYCAAHSRGVLLVRAGPAEGQFLLGADAQAQLTAVSGCVMSSSLSPQPPVANTTVDIVIVGQDELGVPLNAVPVTVSLRDPYGTSVRLGAFSNSITVTLTGGVAIVSFIPTLGGLYTLTLSSSGTTSTRSFSVQHLHIVYLPTRLELFLPHTELSVGEQLSLTAVLYDWQDAPLVGVPVTLLLDGPGNMRTGPIQIQTDLNGAVEYSTVIGTEGTWVVTATFMGAGVHLASEASSTVRVLYGTVMIATLIQSPPPVARVVPVRFTVILEDLGGVALEGRQICYAAYHDSYGIEVSGDIIQTGDQPETVMLVLSRMGNYTIHVFFIGTEHYMRSETALRAYVLGTTAVVIDAPTSFDRSHNKYATMTFTDESGLTLDPRVLSPLLILIGPSGSIDLDMRTTWDSESVVISLYGLSVGRYSLQVMTTNTSSRVGVSVVTTITVTTETALRVNAATLPGLLNWQHTLSIQLKDSLNESLAERTVLVSVFDPDGNEVYGSPLTSQTPVKTSQSGIIVVTWTPVRIGVYRLVFHFEGDSYEQQAELVQYVLVRNMVTVDVQMQNSIDYGQRLIIIISLQSGFSHVGEGYVDVCLLCAGQPVLRERVAVSSLGMARLEYDTVPAGNYTVRITYEGTDRYAPLTITRLLIVRPIVSVAIHPLTEVYVSENVQIRLDVQVHGVDYHWNGTLHVWIEDADGRSISEWHLISDRTATHIVTFVVSEPGEYYVRVSLDQIPVLSEYNTSTRIHAVVRPFSVTLNESTMPVVSGGVVAGLAALLVRRRLRGMLEALPADWDE